MILLLDFVASSVQAGFSTWVSLETGALSLPWQGGTQRQPSEQKSLFSHVHCRQALRREVQNEVFHVLTALWARYGKYIAEKVYEDEKDEGSNPLGGIGALLHVFGSADVFNVRFEAFHFCYVLAVSLHLDSRRLAG